MNKKVFIISLLFLNVLSSKIKYGSDWFIELNQLVLLLAIYLNWGKK